MRMTVYGLSELTKKTVPKFIEKGHEVIIIEKNRELIEAFSEKIDCAFIAGDASHPEVLKEVNPKSTDYFFALSDNSQNNIVACLVARSLGIKRTLLSIDDPDYQNVCAELNLNDTILPNQILSQHLFDSVFNENLVNLFQFLKNRAGFLKVIIDKDTEGGLESLGLNSGVKVACYFRDGEFNHFDESVSFKEKDEVVLIGDSDAVAEFRRERNQHG